MIRMFKSYCEFPNPDIYIILQDFYMLIYKKRREVWKIPKG
jgi:hypothetical protein